MAELKPCVLLSIQPKWCELIASGEKTVEIRKTKPKIQTPFKCYIYCTKPKTKSPLEILETHSKGKIYRANGKVIGEFICDYITPFRAKGLVFDEEIVTKSCLSLGELVKYTPDKPFPKDHLYGWHISNFVIYDKPKSLGDFNHCGDNYHFNPPVMKPPQSWCYVEELEG